VPILIKDETANALVLSIDNNGNMTFGDGTPIGALTIAGHEIIDSGGHIVHGLNSCAAKPMSGSVNCGIDHTVSVATISGRIPTVQLNTTYPSFNYFVSFRDPADPNSQGSPNNSPQYGLPVHQVVPATGNFFVVNQNNSDGPTSDPGSIYYRPDLNTANCGYRWI
jgi:hypothetical protein